MCPWTYVCVNFLSEWRGVSLCSDARTIVLCSRFRAARNLDDILEKLSLVTHCDPYLCGVLAAICKGIQDVCTGKNSQYDDIWDCLKWFETLPSQSCSGKVISGNSKNCRQLHFNLAKYKPDIHCFHVGKKGGPDPNGHFKCQDAVDCSDGLTPEAVFYNSTRAAKLARAEGKRFVV